MKLFDYYTKEGPGIEENAPEKEGVFLYFEILWRKFLKIIVLNMIYCLLSVPFFLIIYFLVTPQTMGILFRGNNSSLNDFSYIMVNFLLSGILFNYYGSGPIAATYAYVTRSFTRSDPIFWVSDGIDKFKENFKKSITLACIDIIVVYLFTLSLRCYMQIGNTIAIVLFGIVLGIYFIYTIAHIFIYQIIVTYDCKIKDIIKEAVVLAMTNFPICILLTLLTAVLCVGIFGLLSNFSIPIYATIGMSLTRFPLEFYATRVIKKNIENN